MSRAMMFPILSVTKVLCIAATNPGLAIEHSRQLSTQNSALKEECSSADLIELARDISAIKSIPNERSLQTELLSSLKRLNEIYTQENELLLRSQQQYDKDSEEHQNMLREVSTMCDCPFR